MSLCVYEGEFVAVVGANGSGKTTLMKLGLGLLRWSRAAWPGAADSLPGAGPRNASASNRWWTCWVLRRPTVADVRAVGGQQQRALIARALVTAPRLLVMDEPTAGVDADARGVLRDSLEHLVNAEGMAVVYVSHDPEGFAGLAHRVVEAWL